MSDRNYWTARLASWTLDDENAYFHEGWFAGWGHALKTWREAESALLAVLDTYEP